VVVVVVGFSDISGSEELFGRLVFDG